jgi:NADH:ubiquinone oxidoreductase subunit C
MLPILHYVNVRRFKRFNFIYNMNKIRYTLYYIHSTCFKFFSCVVVKHNNLHFYVKDNNFIDLFFFLKNNMCLNFSQLMDIVIVDRLELKSSFGKRFSYTYVLLSVHNNMRLFLTGFLGLFESALSLTKLYNSADWLEREVWDMFGIFFIGHSNLRRILTDYGFVGFPLRKDFPLTGYVELRYDEITKSIVVEPLELTQEFRFFKLDNTWITRNVS